MTQKQFRSALNGFNRKDVVLYIEQVNNEHSNALNQLRCENQTLQEKLNAQADSQALVDRIAQLEQALKEKESALADANAQIAAQEEKLQQAVSQAVQQVQADKELEAYRRAEQAERNAKERVDQLYLQATGTLAEATTHVDTAAENFRAIADGLHGQLGELQAAIDSSKNALLDAATAMYTIRLPEKEE